MSVVGRIRDRVLGRDRRTWSGSVEDLLFEGERVRRSVEVGDNRVVVTSHRLLAFTPESDGENYQHVDLPNVADVRASHRAEAGLLGRGARTFLYGGLLVGIGVVVDFESFVPTDVFSTGGGEAAGRIGIGGVLGLMNRFLGLVASLDDLARLFGALLLLLSTVIFGVYLLTREQVLTVAVAGDKEDIAVPAEEAAVDEAVTALERELFENAGREPESDPGGSTAPVSGR